MLILVVVGKVSGMDKVDSYLFCIYGNSRWSVKLTNCCSFASISVQRISELSKLMVT